MLISLHLDAQGFVPELYLDHIPISPHKTIQASEHMRAILPEGRHTLRINGREPGVFDLRVSASELYADEGKTTITVNESLQGSLPAHTSRATYRVMIPQPGTYTIHLSSSQFDPYLVLQKNGQTIAENDDIDAHHNDLNSRIVADLVRGEYVIHVITWDKTPRRTHYRLHIEAQHAELLYVTDLNQLRPHNSLYYP